MSGADLPFGSEFSPTSVESLPEFLEIVRGNEGDRAGLEAALRARYFEARPADEGNKNTLAYNMAHSANDYGIIDDEGNLTEFGRELYEMREDETSLHDAFARHILRNRNGRGLLQCVRDLQVGGSSTALPDLGEALLKRGIGLGKREGRGTKRISTVRLWLAKAGVVSKSGWQINQAKLDALVGKSEAEIEALTRFTRQQRAFLKALANMGPGPHIARSVEDVASTYGVRFNPKALSSRVLPGLEREGFINVTKSNRSRSPIVSATDKLNAEVVIPLLEQLDRLINADLRPFLRKSLEEIYRELKAEDSHTRGLALEALAVKLMRILNLDYVKTRLRGRSTGGAEVDVVFESSHLMYSRWQVQCKHKPKGGVSLDDVAKEVGLTYLIKGDVIVMVSTGDVSHRARAYAEEAKKYKRLCIIFIAGSDLLRIIRDPASLVEVCRYEDPYSLMTLEDVPFSHN